MLTKAPNMRQLGSLWLATLFTLAGCSDDLLGPGDPGSPTQFSREITLSDLQQTLSSGTARLEIELLAEALIARDVVVQGAESISEDESLESLITGMEVSGEEGTLTLALGGLTVSFHPGTRFIAGDDELSFAGFVDRVEAFLAESVDLAVEIRRDPTDSPQDPNDAGFAADEIRLHDGEASPSIEINVDDDNLVINTNRQDGEPDGWVNVLGLSIELRVSDGVTELGEAGGDVSDIVEFEGFVASVNLEAGSFTFGDGIVVFIVDDTHIAQSDGGDALNSLAAVKAALEEGLDVVAWGGGRIESVGPTMIVALEVHFAIAGGEGDGEDNHLVEFEGYVTSVDLDAGTFTLTNGTVVKIVDGTDIKPPSEGEGLMSLEAVKEALDNSLSVVAYGAGDVEIENPLTLVAVEVTFAIAN